MRQVFQNMKKFVFKITSGILFKCGKTYFKLRQIFGIVPRREKDIPHILTFK